MTVPDKRPDHPDFWRMSAAVIENDAANTGGLLDLLKSLGMSDQDSLYYMSYQRVIRATRHNFISPENAAVLGSLWIDGLCAGLRMHVNDRASMAEQVEDALTDLRDGKGDPLALLEGIAARLRA